MNVRYDACKAGVLATRAGVPYGDVELIVDAAWPVIRRAALDEAIKEIEWDEFQDDNECLWSTAMDHACGALEDLRDRER